VIAGNPASLQLRYLQTLTEIGATQNSTVVFPLPLDVVKPFMEAIAEVTANGAASAPGELPEGKRAEMPAPSARVRTPMNP
jgi:hypothetical protein